MGALYLSQSPILRNDVFLNFRGTTSDNGQPRVTEKPLHGIFIREAIAPEDLQSHIGDVFVSFARIQFYYSSVMTCRRTLSHFPGKLVYKKSRGLEHHFHFCEFMGYRLEFANGTAKLVAFFGVLERIVVRMLMWQRHSGRPINTASRTKDRHRCCPAIIHLPQCHLRGHMNVTVKDLCGPDTAVTQGINFLDLDTRKTSINQKFVIPCCFFSP